MFGRLRKRCLLNRRPLKGLLDRLKFQNPGGGRDLLWVGIVLLGLSGGWFMAVQVAGFDGIGMLACL